MTDAKDIEPIVVPAPTSIQEDVDGMIAGFETRKTRLEAEVKRQNLIEHDAAAAARVARAELNRIKRILTAAKGRSAPKAKAAAK